MRSLFTVNIKQVDSCTGRSAVGRASACGPTRFIPQTHGLTAQLNEVTHQVASPGGGLVLCNGDSNSNGASGLIGPPPEQRHRLQ